MSSFAAAAVGRNILLEHVSESERAGCPIGLWELGGDASGESKSLALGGGAAIEETSLPAWRRGAWHPGPRRRGHEGVKLRLRNLLPRRRRCDRRWEWKAAPRRDLRSSR